MKQLFQNMEKYRKAFFALFIILLGSLILLTNKNPDNIPKIITRPPEKQEKETQKKKLLSIVKTEPLLGKDTKNSMDLIKVYFDYPINDETVRYVVNPEIELVFKAHDDQNKILSIFPKKAGWADNTLYTITINTLEGTGDRAIKEPVVLYYSFERETTPRGGEVQTPDPDLDQKNLREYLRGNHNYERIFGEPPPPF